MSDKIAFIRQSQEIPEVPAGEIMSVFPDINLGKPIGDLSGHRIFVATPSKSYYLIRYSYLARLGQLSEWRILNAVINQHPVDWLVDRLALKVIGGTETVLDFTLKISKEQYDKLKDLL